MAFFVTLVAFTHLLQLLRFEEAFIKVMKLSMSILRGRQCAFMSLYVNRSDSVDSWTKTNIDDIFRHGDCINNNNNGRTLNMYSTNYFDFLAWNWTSSL